MPLLSHVLFFKAAIPHHALAHTVFCLYAFQVQLTFSIAPAPGPDALASASAEQPDRPEVVAPIEPVSTPILTAIEPIVGNFMNNAKTIAQDVRSGVDGIKSAVPEIANSFNGRKLLTVNPQSAGYSVHLLVLQLLSAAQYFRI